MSKFTKAIAVLTLVTTYSAIAPLTALAAPPHFNHPTVPIHRFHQPKPIDRHHFRVPPIRDHRFIPPYHHRIHPPRRVVYVNKDSSSKTEIITGILGIVGAVIANKNAAES